MKESFYFDKSLVHIQKISKNIAKDFIVKNHYTHKWSLCTVAYGIYYKSYIESTFFGGYDLKLIGSIIYGNCVGRNASTSISPLLTNDNVLELTRLVILDGYGKNIESYCISESIRQLKNEYPNVKCILSYADTEVGHIGTIYQATGFLYQGDNYADVALMPNYSVSLTGPPDYKWIHSRTVYSKWKTHNVDLLKLRIGKTFWRKKESGKNRYIKFISSKVDNKKLTKSLKHSILPYPKNNTYKEQIYQIDVENNNEKTFF